MAKSKSGHAPGGCQVIGLGINAADSSGCQGTTPYSELRCPSVQTSDDPPSSSPDLVTDQPRRPTGNLVTLRLTKLAEHQQRILELCEVPRTQADLMGAVGVSDRTFFRRDNLEPLIQAHLIQITHLEDPNHPKQLYVVTETGFGLLPVKEPEGEDQHGEA